MALSWADFTGIRNAHKSLRSSRGVAACTGRSLTRTKRAWGTPDVNAANVRTEI